MSEKVFRNSIFRSHHKILNFFAFKPPSVCGFSSWKTFSFKSHREWRDKSFWFAANDNLHKLTNSFGMNSWQSTGHEQWQTWKFIAPLFFAIFCRTCLRHSSQCHRNYKKREQGIRGTWSSLVIFHSTQKKIVIVRNILSNFQFCQVLRSFGKSNSEFRQPSNPQ